MCITSDLNFDTGIAALPPDQALVWGFRSGERGTHTSRTIMFNELAYLLDAVPGGVSREDYADAVMENNYLGKKTAATRKLSFQRLTELYGLDGRLGLAQIQSASAGTPARPGTRSAVAGYSTGRYRYPVWARVWATSHEGCSLRRRRGSPEQGDARQGRAQCLFVLDTVRPFARKRAKDQATCRSDASSNHVRIVTRVRSWASRSFAVRNTLGRHPGFASRRTH